jgi:hypothetical protein
MRNFYNQPTNKIFDKMFGKTARQIQADPTLDLTKCKCCQCGKLECKGCIEGHVVLGPKLPTSFLEKGLMDANGCCHGPDNGLIFEYERPGSSNYAPECCPGVQQPCCPPGQDPSTCVDLEGNPLPTCDPNDIGFGVRKCCGIRELGASNVRFYYNYAGKYFRMDYSATGKYNTVWPQNGRPRLCSTCDPSSLDSARRLTFSSEARETCLDYMPPRAIDDQVDPIDGVCSTILIPWNNCQCMGEGPLKDNYRESKRLSYHRKREMERLPYYRWLLDIMCYDRGNVVANPHYRYQEGQQIPVNSNGTLYEHLLAVVHCEHWYELSFCDENPEHGDPGELGAGMTDSSGNPINVITSRLAPRFWVYACSGVPFFDFELEEARKKGYIDDSQYAEILRAFDEGKTPSQEIMKNLSQGGYFDTGDWRQAALAELQELRSRKFTASTYGVNLNGDPNIGSCCTQNDAGFNLCVGGVSAEYCSLTGGNFFPLTDCSSNVCGNAFCSELNLLGPVRKRYWQDNINVPGVNTPGRLDPKKARINSVSSPNGTIIEPIINSTIDSTLQSLQLPFSLIRDPWNGGPYPIDPGPGATGDVKQEWEDFLFWRESQWLYMHARPGGWDYVCSGYQNPQNPDPTLRIPDLPRRFSNVPGALQSAGCLDGLLGVPVEEREVSGGCSSLKCGEIDPITQQFVQYPLVGCNDAQNCVAEACSPDASLYCPDNPERGGGPTYCRNIAMAASCNGIRFVYTTYKPTTRYSSVTQTNGTYYTCDKKVDAFLYRVNLTKGNYDSFCPFQCRTVSVPKAIERAIPILNSNKATYGLSCLANDGPRPDTAISLCPGFYCFGALPDNPLQNPEDGTYGGRIPYGPYISPNCCRRRNTGEIFLPSPQDPTHDAANRQSCPHYPGPGYPGLYDGQFVGINYETNPYGCCWKCSLSGQTGECLGRMREFECRTRPENDGVNFTTIHKTEIINDCCNVGYNCGCSTNFAQDCTGYN